MRRAVLIYNPASGLQWNHRASVIDDALEVLRQSGVEADAEPWVCGTATRHHGAYGWIAVVWPGDEVAPLLWMQTAPALTETT